MLFRVERLAKINPDFRARHAELAREADSGTTNVEMKKYVNLVIKKHLKYGAVPKPSVTIKRMNRVV